jgi:hypothetical protein
MENRTEGWSPTARCVDTAVDLRLPRPDPGEKTDAVKGAFRAVAGLRRKLFGLTDYGPNFWTNLDRIDAGTRGEFR